MANVMATSPKTDHTRISRLLGDGMGGRSNISRLLRCACCDASPSVMRGAIIRSKAPVQGPNAFGTCAIWKQFPNAAFTLYNASTTTQPGGETEEEFRLGTFELPTNSSYSRESEWALACRFQI